MLGIHQRQRNEGAAVLLPGGENGQAVQVGRLFDHVQHWSVFDAACPQLQCLQRQIAVLPKLGEIGRQERLSEMDDLLNELLRLRAKGEFDALGGSEQVGNYRKGAVFDPVEQEGRPVLLNDTAMNFCDLQARIDFCINRN